MPVGRLPPRVVQRSDPGHCPTLRPQPATLNLNPQPSTPNPQVWQEQSLRPVWWFLVPPIRSFHILPPSSFPHTLLAEPVLDCFPRGQSPNRPRRHTLSEASVEDLLNSSGREEWRRAPVVLRQDRLCLLHSFLSHLTGCEAPGWSGLAPQHANNRLALPEPLPPDGSRPIALLSNSLWHHGQHTPVFKNAAPRQCNGSER